MSRRLARPLRAASLTWYLLAPLVDDDSQGWHLTADKQEAIMRAERAIEKDTVDMHPNNHTATGPAAIAHKASGHCPLGRRGPSRRRDVRGTLDSGDFDGKKAAWYHRYPAKSTRVGHPF